MHGSLKIAVLACGLAAWPTSVYPQLIKLSSTSSMAGADVSDFQFTPDHTRVVYYGDLLTNGVFDLFSTATSGREPQLKLSAGTSADKDVFSNYQLTPDGSRVVYRGDLITDGVPELFAASTTAAGTQVKLSVTSTAGADVSNFQLTPDGSRVIYRGDLVTRDVEQLYGASTTSVGTQVGLSFTSLPNGDVSSHQITSDGGIVVYQGDLAANGVNLLYRSSTAVSGTQGRLSLTSLPGADVSSYQLTPDGSRVVYRGDLVTDGVFALYSASTIATGTQINLSMTALAGGDVSDYQLTPDGGHVVYRGDLVTDGALALYSSSTIAGGAQISLSSTTLAGADISDYQITPDGSRVVYRGDLVEDGVSALYSSSTTTSGTQLDLSSTTLAGASVSSDYKLVPDGGRVVYRGALSKDNVVELYSASTSASGTQVGLSSTALTEADIFDFQLTPDGSRVVYRGDLTTGDRFELYSASTSAGGTQVRLNNPLSGADDWISDIQISDDGQFLAFMAGTTTDPLDETKFVGKELYWTPIIGGGATSVAVANTEITSYQFNGDTLIFTGDLDTPGKIELYHFIWFVGNHDSDRDVDGADFLTWQRDDSPNPLSMSDLADWRENFGNLASPMTAASTAVPEPVTGLMLLLGMAALSTGGLSRRRHKL